MRVAALIAAFMTAATPALAGDAQTAMNGTWVSPFSTFTIDWTAGTYKGVSVGDPLEATIELVSEDANLVTYKSSSGSVFVAQIGADGKTMVITKQGGGLPLVFTRTK